jgi:DNA-directed RNA polymerase specialized sigma24 family protein
VPVPHARLLRHIHQLLPLDCDTDDADGELLARYVHHRDEVAFTAIVRRHGSMVLNLCRRLIGDTHAAEDAFQATFLVLARQAGSIRRAGALSAWLYGIAHRIAIKARASAARTKTNVSLSIPDARLDPLSQVSARGAAYP